MTLNECCCSIVWCNWRQCDALCEKLATRCKQRRKHCRDETTHSLSYCDGSQTSLACASAAAGWFACPRWYHQPGCPCRAAVTLQDVILGQQWVILASVVLLHFQSTSLSTAQAWGACADAHRCCFAQPAWGAVADAAAMCWLPCRSEFVFQNPNSKGSCGCGESFTT